MSKRILHGTVLVLLTGTSFWACAPRVVAPEKVVEEVAREEVSPERLEAERIARAIEEDERERKAAFDTAERAFHDGELERALELFIAFTESYPEDERADDAYIRLGEIYLEEDDLDGAVRSFQKVVTDYVGYELFSEAKYRLAKAFFRRGDYNDAIQTLKSLFETPLKRGRKVFVATTIADSYLNLGRDVDAISWYMRALDESPEEEDESRIRERVVGIIEERVAVEELGDILTAFEGTFAADYAAFGLIRVMVDEERYEEARAGVQEIIERSDDDELKGRAEEVLRLIAQRMEVDADTIGCILPLSGRFAPYGQNVLKGIQLAAGIFGGGEGGSVNLVVRDSGGDPVEAIRAVEELVEEERVIAIVGPLLSSVAEAAAFKAQEKGVPMVALSQKMGIPEIGDYVFRNFLTSRLQTRTLARHAVKDLGIKRFAILYPKDYYGEELMNLFWNEVSYLGGEVVGIEGYDKGKYDFGKEIKRLVGMDKIDKRAEKEKPESERLWPIVDFEAVFIPDSYDKAAMIAPQLAYNDILGVKLIGPNSWNSPKLAEMGGEYAEGALFVDGFYPESRYEGAVNFASDFESVFGEKPGVLEAQAFDATKMVVSLIGSGEAKSRMEIRDALLSLRSFEGATGMTAVTGAGDVDKSLFVLNIRKGEIVEAERTDIPETENEYHEEDAPLIQ